MSNKGHKTAGIALLTALLCSLAPSSLPAASTADLQVSHTGFVMNHSTKAWVSTLKITNKSNIPISRSIRILLKNLSPNATLIDFSGTGDPFVDVTLDRLAPGAAISVPIKFTNSAMNAFITFTPVISAGGN